MQQTRRTMLRRTGLVLPGLACALVATQAVAAVEPPPGDRNSPYNPFGTGRDACPLCAAKQDCAQHPFT